MIGRLPIIQPSSRTVSAAPVHQGHRQPKLESLTGYRPSREQPQRLRSLACRRHNPPAHARWDILRDSSRWRGCSQASARTASARNKSDHLASERQPASVRHTDACHSQGAQGTDAEHPQAGSCQTAKDDGGKPGVRFLARSKRGTRFRTTSLLGGTRQRRRRFCSPWVGRDQGRRHCRWRSPDDRNWLSFHDRYQYTLSREAVWSTLRSSSKSAQRDSQSTLYEHNDNSKLTSHALKENRALTATAIQKVGPDRP